MRWGRDRLGWIAIAIVTVLGVAALTPAVAAAEEVQDTEAPQLVGLTIEPEEVDITAEDQKVTVKAHITDNLAGLENRLDRLPRTGLQTAGLRWLWQLQPRLRQRDRRHLLHGRLADLDHRHRAGRDRDGRCGRHHSERDQCDRVGGSLPILASGDPHGQPEFVGPRAESHLHRESRSDRQRSAGADRDGHLRWRCDDARRRLAEQRRGHFQHYRVAAGSDEVVAEYSGDSYFGPGESTPTITFSEGATVLATTSIVGTSAKYSFKPLPPGTHEIAAVYNGGADCEASEPALISQVITP